MSQYRFSYDDAYVIDFASRYRRQRRAYPWFTVVRVVCIAGLVALLAVIVVLAVRQPNREWLALLSLSLVPLFFIVLLLLGPRLDFALLKRGIRKSPFFGCEVQIAVSDAGVSVDTPKSQLSLSWSAYTRAKRLATGFILFSGPSPAHWLPDRALVAGTVGDVERLLTAKLGNNASAAA
jgi:hypothetical protein